MKKHISVHILRISTCLLLCLGMAFTSVHAEQRIIEADGFYTVENGLEENFSIARERAKSQALRKASEEACIFVENVSEANQGQLTQDEIRTISSSILHMQGEPKYKTEVIGEDAIRFHCHVTVVAERSNVIDALQRDRKSLEEAVRRNKELETEFDRIQRENEELKAQYAKAVTEVQRQEIRAQVRKNDKEFQAVQWLEKGYQMDDMKNYSQAINAYQSAISLNPDFAEAYNNLGVSYSKIGEYAKAIESFQKSLSIHPQDAVTYYNLGHACYDMGEYDMAIYAYRQALDINPQFMEAYCNLGNTYNRVGKCEDAIENFQKALSFDSQLAPAYCGLGYAYGEIGEVDKAIAFYTKTIQLNPRSMTAYYNRGVEYENLHRYQEAKRDYAKAYELAPDNAMIASKKKLSENW